VTAVEHPLRRRRDDVPEPVSPRAGWEAVRRVRTAMVAGHRGTVLAVALVGLAIALPIPTLFQYQGPPMEEGFMLVFPERVLAGDVPNKDFLHLYGPASLWSLAAWFKIVGTTLSAERLYGLAQHLGIIFALFRLALPWGRRVATVCGFLGVLLVITPIGLAALAWNGGVALGLIGLSIALVGAQRAERGERGARLRLVLGGVVLGLALLWRPDLVVGIGLAGIALLWRRWGRDLLVPLVGGVLLGVAPILVHLAMAGPGNVVEGMFLQPVFDLRGGRHLPIPPSWDKNDGVLQAVAQLRVPDWPVPMVPASAQVTLWFLALPVAALALLATGIVAVRRDPAAMRSRILVVVGAFGFGLLPQALQRPDTTHLAWVSCVSMVFLPVAFVQWGEWWAASRRGRPVGRFTGLLRHDDGRLRGPSRTAVALLPLVLVVLLIPAYTTRTWVDLTRQNFEGEYFGWDVRRGDRTFFLGAENIAVSAQSVTDALDARIQPDERLFVGTADLRKTPYSDAFFYYLFPEATPATYYIEMDPGIANAEDSGLADEVAGSDYLILSHVWDPWDEPNDSRLFGSDGPNEVVADQFCPLNPETDFYVLYERC
jgi:hypothetical protein